MRNRLERIRKQFENYGILEVTADDVRWLMAEIDRLKKLNLELQKRLIHASTKKGPYIKEEHE